MTNIDNYKRGIIVQEILLAALDRLDNDLDTLWSLMSIEEHAEANMLAVAWKPSMIPHHYEDDCIEFIDGKIDSLLDNLKGQPA